MRITVDLPDETTALVLTFTYNGLWPSYNLHTASFGPDEVHDGAELKAPKERKDENVNGSIAK